MASNMQGALDARAKLASPARQEDEERDEKRLSKADRTARPTSSATFSTASVKTGKAQIEHMFSGLPPKAPAAMESAALTPPVRPRAQGADAFLRGQPRCHF